MTNPDDSQREELTADERQAVARLRAHFSQTPDEATLGGAKALYSLRDPEAILAEWSQEALLAVRSNAVAQDDAVLHHADGNSEITMMPSPGRLDGSVLPADARVVVERIGGTSQAVDVDGAGGFSLEVSGLVRLRVIREGVPDTVTDVVSVPQ